MAISICKASSSRAADRIKIHVIDATSCRASIGHCTTRLNSKTIIKPKFNQNCQCCLLQICVVTFSMEFASHYNGAPYWWMHRWRECMHRIQIELHYDIIIYRYATILNYFTPLRSCVLSERWKRPSLTRASYATLIWHKVYVEYCAFEQRHSRHGNVNNCVWRDARQGFLMGKHHFDIQLTAFKCNHSGQHDHSCWCPASWK